MEYALIIGAKSDIGRALAARYARAGYNLYLAARKSEELTREADNLRIRYNVRVATLEFDLLDTGNHEEIYKQLSPRPAGTICVAGYLGDQKIAEIDFSEARKIIDTNFTGWVSLLNIIAEDYESSGSGFIIGISSVAGDRGRRSNTIYGSSKAAFTTYLSGLRHRLHSSGVVVLTVKPGFVRTRMTEGMDLPEKLTAKPEEVAEDVFRAHRKARAIVYTRWYWRWIMWVITRMPDRLFQRISI